ncbi:MAG: GIY-YIG nuclease family protein [Candidatus Caldatribacteriota bacterium]
MTQGIYEIYCLSNHRRYIGSSRNIEKRWENHISSLNNNSHHNHYLQKAWMNYGEGNFVFCILEEVNEESNLFKTEEKYIKKFKFNRLFNIMRKPGAVPKKTSKWAKIKEKRDKEREKEEFAWGVN